MEKITHISVGRDDVSDPEGPPQPVYVDPPEPDILDDEPFVSGRHRIERTPEREDEKPPSTLWSWTEGAG
ncbi:MAG: hypothetical protein Q8K79_06395 [Solirubrobacteraceae bacterium]|nr:hypothetical protein [Solirubrobacteraceae bacterium]